MTSIVNAAYVDKVKNQKILLDTNIWILLEGFSLSAEPSVVDIYSSAYAKLRAQNEILLNDYVLGEFCNRCSRLEFDAYVSSLELQAGNRPPSYKRHRKSAEFAPSMESVRDTCLNILSDCTFSTISHEAYAIEKVLNEFCGGQLDFSDIILREFCKSTGAMLMTDDADFAGCGVPLITANRRLTRK